MALSKVNPNLVQNFGRRNLIINGAMQVEQRGAYTISTTGSPEYGGPDRFHVWSYTSGEEVIAEISKSTVGGTPTGFANTYRFDVLTAESSVAANEAVVVAQYIEAQDCQHLEYGTSDAKSVTLSFWIKTSVTGTYCFFLQNDDGDRIQVKEYTVTSANTWEKKIITIPGDTAGTINNDTGRGLWCGWVLMAGTDRHGSKDTWRTTDADYATSNQVNAVNDVANNIYFTGIQLEVGDTATDFEHRSYGEELALCQRYFEIVGNWSSTSQFYAYPIFKSRSASIGITVHYRVQKRATPAVTSYDRLGTTTGVFTQISNGTNLAIQFGPTGDVNGLYRTQHATQPVAVTTSAYGLKIKVDAEL
jgi:hypothetical protein